jgi:endoglucanase
MKKTLLLFFIYCWNSGLAQEKTNSSIRLTQIGFYPNEQKIAVVLSTEATTFYITKGTETKKLFEGKLSEVKKASYSPRVSRIADFTSFTSSGKFVLHISGLADSYPFEIKNKVLEPIAKASLKAFYYQRFSIPLTKEFAGQWSRPASSSHAEIRIHPSAATNKRPAGFTVSSTRGWIDAGDYNKYIVNSGITTATLLQAYEDYSSYYDTLTVTIPESKNRLPDILDEVLWNLRWMLTMQDPSDGGVYHKCTNADFDAMIMSHEGKTPRYMVQKSTAAALNFVAVTTIASRVLEKFSKQLPDLADSCRKAAEQAWAWAKKNPAIIYDQTKMNQQFDPDVNTGAYGDDQLADEFIWAAAELAVTTANANYLNGINLEPDATNPVPSWNEVRLLGYYTLVNHGANLGNDYEPLIESIKRRILSEATRMTDEVSQSRYQTVMGLSANDFVWGSNAVAANQGILMLQAYQISNDKKFFNAALSNIDYMLGRNATGYSFVTGFGKKTPVHIHHRPSEADGIVDPVPGLLAGGPNPGMQDKCSYASSIADEAYVDDVCSYASNEVAINWNAPLVYLSGAIEAITLTAKK